MTGWPWAIVALSMLVMVITGMVSRGKLAAGIQGAAIVVACLAIIWISSVPWVLKLWEALK